MKVVEGMYTFIDYYKNKVTLSFDDHPYSEQPKHVWVICKYNKKWLLTRHKDRGLEFPGGKVEQGETAEEGAIREVMEETGGMIKTLHYIGQYYVEGKSDHIIKNVYFADVEELTDQPTYYETEGPVLLETVPINVKHNERYSFIMKDDVLTYSLQYIEEKYNI